MTNQEFAYWLKGYFQLEGAAATLTGKQLRMIKNHLNLVQEVDGYIGMDHVWLFKRLATVVAEDNPDPDFLVDVETHIRNHYVK